jgi:putative transposase
LIAGIVQASGDMTVIAGPLGSVQAMPRATSANERKQVVEAYLARKASDKSTTYEMVAEEFGVAPASLNRWLRLARETGTVEPRRRKQRVLGRRLTREQADAMAAWVQSNPTTRLWEVCVRMEQEHGVSLSEATVRRELHARNIHMRRLPKLAPDAGSPDPPGDARRYTRRHRRQPEDKPHRRSYPSDLTDAEWTQVEPLWREHARSVPAAHAVRDVIDAIRYLAAAGCPWRYLPNDFPPHTTVRRWFDQWHRDGTFDRVNDALRRLLRRRAGREDTPSVLIIDSLSTKSAEGGEARGYDGGKKVSGRKRHIAVDTEGWPWLMVVHGAGLQDRDGIDLLIPDAVKTMLPRLKTIIADAGYQGRAERKTLERTGVPVQIVRRRGDTTNGEWGGPEGPAPAPVPRFQVLPKRWIVERSLAWCSRRRRLARDYERSVHAANAWLKVAFQHTMTARTPG